MRSSLGRLIRLRGIGERGTSSITCRVPTRTNGSNMNMNRNRNSSSYASIPPHFNSFQASHFESATKSEEAKIPQGNEELDKVFIKKGDILNLNDILFTKERDYLIKNNNQQVKAEQLEGKVIGIYFAPLAHDSYSYHETKWETTFVIDTYNDLQRNNDFEVVLVAEITEAPQRSLLNAFHKHSLQFDCQMHFDNLFCYMPWTAIPFSDEASRDRLQRSFGVRQRSCYSSSNHMFVIVDPTGVVLQYDAWQFVFDYGALGYPFSDERIKCLMDEDDATVKQPSLEKLLASPHRDYVISNKGEQVPIHTLKTKVVALYFCTNFCSYSQLFNELKSAYEELGQVKKNFEVVLIYSREFGHNNEWPSEELFWKEFNNMPWLALPFGDPNCKMLNRIFAISYNEELAHGSLVVFGPHAEFIEPFGADILRLYKIRGFPFTRKRASELETEKLKELKLERIWDPNTLFRRKDGSWVPFCQIAGKRIVLILEPSDVFKDHRVEAHNAKFLMMLRKRYRETKGTAEEFEVIRVLKGKKGSPTSAGLVRGMPWLVSCARKWIHADLGSWCNGELADSGLFSVIAFDEDGKLVRKSNYPTFEEEMKFPFSACGLEEEALAQLNTHFNWNYWDYFYNGRIYSYKDRMIKVNLSTMRIG